MSERLRRQASEAAACFNHHLCFQCTEPAAPHPPTHTSWTSDNRAAWPRLNPEPTERTRTPTQTISDPHLQVGPDVISCTRCSSRKLFLTWCLAQKTLVRVKAELHPPTLPLPPLVKAAPAICWVGSVVNHAGWTSRAIMAALWRHDPRAARAPSAWNSLWSTSWSCGSGATKHQNKFLQICFCLHG